MVKLKRSSGFSTVTRVRASGPALLQPHPFAAEDSRRALCVNSRHDQRHGSHLHGTEKGGGGEEEEEEEEGGG